MNIEDAIATLLSEAGCADVYTAPPSITACAEPITVGRAAFERATRLADGERGTDQLSVLVCREALDDARDAAYEVEHIIRAAQWERYGDLGCARICSCDTRAPAFKERDGSGRCVYEVPVVLVVQRDVI